jgi:ubiquitin-conjugating enzyme (huntingtin interacting protein 2)
VRTFGRETNLKDAEVAKHYLSDRVSFDATARYWAETFAGAPSKKNSPSANTPKIGSSPLYPPVLFLRGLTGFVDAASMYGLSPETVSRYVNMGFRRDLVIEKMRKLNIRSLTLDESEGERGSRLIEELLASS